MKDIDFDELDRAVNSLMNSVPNDDNDASDDGLVAAVQIQDAATADSSAEEAVATDNHGDVSSADESSEIQLAIPSELMIVEETESDEAEENEQENSEKKEDEKPSVSAAPTTPVASLPTVRRGRFMDMVRSPVSEARKPAPSAMPSRRGATLQPVTSPPPVTPSVESSLNTNISMGSWQVEPPTAGEPKEVVSPDLTQPVAPLSTPEVGPPVLPFLPDAKVEKRPLGRPTEPQPAPMIPPAPEPTSPLLSADPTVLGSPTTEPNVSPNEDAQLPGQPLPAELGSELLSIETSTDMLPVDTPPVMPNIPAQSASHSLHIPGVSRPSAAASIPQQYKVQPKNEADEPAAGAIYDTATYHQPLAHPAKKKPGWLWVAAIIIILLLGVAGGAAVYHFGLNG